MDNPNNKFPSHIFRAYDIRGKVQLLSPQVVKSIASALIQQYQQAGQQRIVIGYDARLTSPRYAKFIQGYFLEAGFDAVLMGCCSSPAMYYIARCFDGNGIMVTASHNPKSDNGIKWIIQGEPPCPDLIQQVAQWAKQSFISHEPLELPEEPHTIVVKYCLEYQSSILNDIELKRPFKVVLDGLNGAAGHCAALVLKKLGCDVVKLRCQADGNFPDHAPDPSQAHHLCLTKQQIIEQHADVGIALDGDGDRVVLLDEKANIISADRLLSLFAEICLKQHPAHEVVFDVKCSTMVADTVTQAGGQAKMIRTGSSFLRKYLAQSEGKAVFGGEYAGHYVFNDGRGFGYDDGLYAALRVLEYLGERPHLTLSELLSQYPERSCTEDTYISTHNLKPDAVLKMIEQNSQGSEAKLSKIDGIRLDFKDGFGIIRASNTGEYFTVRFDAESPDRLNDIREHFVAMLNDQYPQIAQDILKAQ